MRPRSSRECFSSVAIRAMPSMRLQPKELRSSVISPFFRFGVYGSGEAKWNPVRNTAELKPFDEIKMGASKFIFVPLCGDNFKWEL